MKRVFTEEHRRHLSEAAGWNLVDRTNKKYGRLTVIERAPNINNKTRWKCQCDCGNIITVYASCLCKPHEITCGCGRKKLKPHQWAYLILLKQSNERDIECPMTFEEFLTFTTIDQCHYCGASINWYPYYNTRIPKCYNIDRIDSDKGYTKDNCVVCCKTCNYMKLQMTTTEFINHCERIIKWQQYRQTQNN